MDCKHNIDFIFEYLDGDGDLAFNESFIKHIAECKKCKEAYEVEKMIRDACKFSDKNEIDLPDEFHASFMSKLQLEISHTENTRTAELLAEPSVDDVRAIGSDVVPDIVTDIVPDIQSLKRKPFYRRFSLVSQLAAILVISLVVGTSAFVIIKQFSMKNSSGNPSILANNARVEHQPTTESAAPAPFAVDEFEQDAVTDNPSDDVIPSVGEDGIELGLSAVQENNSKETNVMIDSAAASALTVPQATTEVDTAENEAVTIESSAGTQKTTKAKTSPKNSSVQPELKSPDAVMASEMELNGEKNVVDGRVLMEDDSGLKIISSAGEQMSDIEFFSEEESNVVGSEAAQDGKTGKTGNRENSNNLENTGNTEGQRDLNPSTFAIDLTTAPTSPNGAVTTEQSADRNDPASNEKISNMEYASFTGQESNLGYYENTLKEITKVHSGEIVRTDTASNHSTWDITVQYDEIDELISDISAELSSHSVVLNYSVENHQSAAVTGTGIMPAANTAESQEHQDTATLRLTFEYRGNDGEQ